MNSTLETIEEAVCTNYGITGQELFANTRKRHIVRIRQMFYYLARRYTLKSLSDIGVYAGYVRGCPFDHATVLHGANCIVDQLHLERRKRDKEMTENVDNIRHLIMDAQYCTTNLIPLDINLLLLTEKYSQNSIAV